ATVNASAPGCGATPSAVAAINGGATAIPTTGGTPAAAAAAAGWLITSASPYDGAGIEAAAAATTAGATIGRSGVPADVLATAFGPAPVSCGDTAGGRASAVAVASVAPNPGVTNGASIAAVAVAAVAPITPSDTSDHTSRSPR